MAYDLVVGKSKYTKDNPIIVGHIDFDEYLSLCSLAKKHEINFLHRLSNLFDDQSFSTTELKQAIQSLLLLLPTKLSVQERNLAHKLISVVSYALNENEPLHGVAD